MIIELVKEDNKVVKTKITKPEWWMSNQYQQILHFQITYEKSRIQ